MSAHSVKKTSRPARPNRVITLALGAAVCAASTAFVSPSTTGHRGLLMLWLPGLVGMAILALLFRANGHRIRRERAGRVGPGRLYCSVIGSSDRALRGRQQLLVDFCAAGRVSIVDETRVIWTSPYSSISDIRVDGPGSRITIIAKTASITLRTAEPMPLHLDAILGNLVAGVRRRAVRPAARVSVGAS